MSGPHDTSGPGHAETLKDPSLGEETLPPDPGGNVSSQAGEGLTAEETGRYAARGELGQGGLGRVYVALDGHVGREVAVKELRPDVVGELEGDGERDQARLRVGQRFLREARVTGQLEHPGIMPVYEIGKRSTGQLYYTMRRVKGRSLANALEQAGDSLRERLALLPHYRDLCQAIAYAHSRGVIHRDIKPDNVMIGEFGETVVLDWGLAKVLGEPDATEARWEESLERLAHQDAVETVAGLAMGTPSYMAPEQARGQLQQVDPVSDVYALGAVLYELLSGRPPFVGPDALSVLTQVVNAVPEPVQHVTPEAPMELAAVAGKAVSSRREDRYQSAAELADDIEAYMSGDRVSAYDYSSWEVFRRFVGRHKAVFATVAVVALALAATAVISALSYTREKQARLREETARKRETRARRQAVTLSNALKRSVDKQRHARREALYHLAQAYNEKALAMERVQQHVTARIFAAASLQSNPAYSRSPHFVTGFANSHPGALDLKAQAASVIYRTRHHPTLKLVRTLWAPKGQQWERMGARAAVAVSAGSDGTLRLADMRTGAPGRVLKGHTKPIRGASFSPDGKHLVTASADGTVRLWDLTTGKEQRRLALPRGVSPADVAWSPEGERVAVGDRKGGCTIYRTQDGQVTHRLGGAGSGTFQLAWAPGGRQVAIVTWDRSLRVWHLPTPGALGRAHGVTVLPTTPQGWHTAIFSGDGKQLFTADWGKTITLFETKTWKQTRRLAGHQETVYGMALSPNGKMLLSGGLDRQLAIWDLNGNRRLAAITAHEERVRQLVFLAGDPARGRRRFATMSMDGSIKVWQWQAGQPPRALRGHRTRVSSLALAPGGATFASAGASKHVRLWETGTGRQRRLLEGHTARVNGLAYSPKGDRLASLSWDQTIRIWNPATGRTIRILRGHKDRPYSVAWSPDGGRLASTNRAGVVRLWNALTGAPLRHWTAHRGYAWNVAFSPDGNSLATVGFEPNVKIWDARSGALRYQLTGHTDWVSGLHFSPDGNSLLTSSRDKTALIWDLRQRRIRTRLKGHTLWVNYAHFFPHGRLVATCSDDHQVRIWSARTGEPLLVIPTAHSVEALAITPDNRQLLVGAGSRIEFHDMAGVDHLPDPTLLLERAQRAVGLKLRGFVIAPVGRPR